MVWQVRSERLGLNPGTAFETVELPLILPGLSTGEGGGIPGVGVKSVDIWRNTGGEGGLLDCN